MEVKGQVTRISVHLIVCISCHEAVVEVDRFNLMVDFIKIVAHKECVSLPRTPWIKLCKGTMVEIGFPSKNADTFISGIGYLCVGDKTFTIFQE